jgi:hypothetical protein
MRASVSGFSIFFFLPLFIVSAPAFAQNATVDTPAAQVEASPAADTQRAPDPIYRKIYTGANDYKDGRYAKAMRELESATADLRKLRANMLTALFPAAPAGWTVVEKKGMEGGISESFMGGGTVASREYSNGKDTLEASIMMDSSLVSSMLDMVAAIGGLKNAAHEDGSYDLNGYRAEFKPAKNNKKKELKVIVGKAVVSVEGESLTKEFADSFTKSMDLQKIESISKE